MRVASLGVARPAYYDRNATSVVNQYSGTLTQHTNTTRWTYTVASGKKLLVETLEVFDLTVTAAAAPLRLAVAIQVTSGASNFSLARVDHQQSASTTTPTFVCMQAATTLYAGETIYSPTFMDSVTGSVFMSSSSKGTLYDA